MVDSKQRLDFLNYFYKYLEDNEVEVQRAALRSFKTCSRYIPVDNIEKEIVPRLNKYFLAPLSNLPQSEQANNPNAMPININGPSEVLIKNQHLAENLMHIGSGSNGDREKIRKVLLPVFEKLLQSNQPSVRIRLFNNTGDLVRMFGRQMLFDVIKKEFIKFSSDSTWRVRKEGYEMLANFSNEFVEVIFKTPEILAKIHAGMQDRVSLNILRLNIKNYL